MVCLLGALSSCEAPFAFPPKVDPNSKPIVEAVPVIGSSNSAQIIPSRTTGVAPLSVHFDATGSSSVLTAYPYRDIRYTWDFGDSTAASQVWTTGARANTLSKNVDSGPVAAHVFDQPGDYTVKLTCEDGTSTVSSTVSIHVDDPEVTYKLAKTICVSSTELPQPGVNGVPAGAQCYQIPTVEAAVAKITANDQRLLFMRGDTFTVSATNYLPNFTGLTVGAYGTAVAKPLIKFIGANVNYGAFCPRGGDNRIMDLAFDTDMPEFHAAQTLKFTVRPLSVSFPVDHTLVYRLDCTHVSTIAFLGGHYAMVVDCSLQDAGGGFGNVGIWYATPGIGGAILGTRLVNCAWIEHNIRIHLSSKTVIAHNYTSIPAVGKRLMTIRGQDNLDNSLPPEWAELILISDNQFGSDTEAGGSLQVAPTATGFNEPIRNILIEKNLFSGPSSAPSSVGIDSGPGLVFRNNIVLFKGTVANGFQFLDLGHNNIDGSPTAHDMWIVNNSLYSEHSGNFSFMQAVHYSLPDPYDIHFINNLVYAPNSVKNAGGNGTADVLSLYSLTFDATTSSDNSQLKGTAPGWVSPSPSSPSDFALQAGSYAHNKGSAAPVLEDFFGALRTGTMDMGAVNLDP